MRSMRKAAQWNYFLCCLVVCCFVWLAPDKAIAIVGPRTGIGSARLELFMFQLFLALSITVQRNPLGIKVARVAAVSLGAINFARLLVGLLSNVDERHHAPLSALGFYIWLSSVALGVWWPDKHEGGSTKEYIHRQRP